MAVQGVAWGISIAGWIMSPIISKLLDKVLSYCKFDKEETLQRLLTDVLPRLTLTLEAAEAVNHRVFFEAIVEGLKSAFYDIEDILDDLEYIRHQKKLDEQKRSSSKQKKKRPRIASDAEAGPSNQGICIEPSLTLTASLNIRLKDKMATIEKLIDKAQGIIALAKPSNKGETVTAKKIHTRSTSAPTGKVTGRDEHRDKITKMLRNEEGDANPSSSDSKCFSAIGIYGISGSGKTTLAQHVCKYEESEDYFDLVMWVHVSQNYSVGDIFKEMFESASVDHNITCPSYNSLDVLEKELEKKLDGKRFLLVLDDIWCTKDVSEQQLPKVLSPLKVGKRGSKILATSRNKDTFSDLGPGVACTVLPIPDLEKQVFLQMFMYYALDGVMVDDPNDSDQTELRIVGDEIAQKLKGSPLAARTVGGQLRKRPNDVEFWRDVRDRDLLNETTGALWWSYQHLDEQVRRCFAYCSIFPRRHRLKRDELVKLWVAEGFIQTTNVEEEMEAVGRDYFHELLATSFVQPAGSNEGCSVYFIHDLMYDLAEKAAGNDCFRIENGLRRKFPHGVRHLFVEKATSDIEEILELENLRTLIIADYYSCVLFDGHFFEKIFEKLKKLRVLHIHIPWSVGNESGEYKIPTTIGHLKHLRSLSVCGCGRRILWPRTLANLYHLQHLSVIKEVEASPDINLGNLTNLRYITSDGKYFSNIGNLTSLQELNQFRVRTEHGHELKQLRDLNKLRGNLVIKHLENVKNKMEALEAKLADKNRLTGLDLQWGEDVTGTFIQACSPEVQVEVLEGLCPPKDLKRLQIWNYEGLRYPNWMVGEGNGGPKYLHELALFRCIRLGPAPEILEFFIHLRELYISECDNWDHLPENVKDLRSLKKLTIDSCPRLMSLPELPRSLQEFVMDFCDEVFMGSCTEIGHPNWQKLQHVDVKKIGMFERGIILFGRS